MSESPRDYHQKSAQKASTLPATFPRPGQSYHTNNGSDWH